MANEPIRLAASVPHGTPSPRRRSSAPPSQADVVKQQEPAPAPKAAPAPAPAASPITDFSGVHASPAVRRLARELDVDLTKREVDLLAVLAEHKTAVLSRAQLLELVWGYDFAADTNVVDVFIGYLRRKLEANGAPRLLHTVRGVGFVLRQQ